MSQVTIYLDEASEKLAKKAARGEGVSVSKWIAVLIQEKTQKTWPPEVLGMFGAWPDFPSLEEIRSGQGEDVPREPF